jgi:hypothetical protein
VTQSRRTRSYICDMVITRTADVGFGIDPESRLNGRYRARLAAQHSLEAVFQEGQRCKNSVIHRVDVKILSFPPTGSFGRLVSRILKRSRAAFVDAAEGLFSNRDANLEQLGSG